MERSGAIERSTCRRSMRVDRTHTSGTGTVAHWPLGDATRNAQSVENVTRDSTKRGIGFLEEWERNFDKPPALVIVIDLIRELSVSTLFSDHLDSSSRVMLDVNRASQEDLSNREDKHRNITEFKCIANKKKLFLSCTASFSITDPMADPTDWRIDKEDMNYEVPGAAWQQTAACGHG